MIIDEYLDARDLLCPLPVLKARKCLQKMAHGGILSIQVTDPAALIDMPHFCLQSGHKLLSTTEIDGGHCFVIQRGTPLFVT